MRIKRIKKNEKKWNKGHDEYKSNKSGSNKNRGRERG